jgi:transcriptional regulator with XRE-family HTH domain
MSKKRSSIPVALGQRVRKRRQLMSMTLQELSKACGVSVSYLSQVERGNAVPTLGTLAEIAAALDVSIDHFIATPRQVDSVTRAGSRQRFSVAGNSVIYEQIGADFPGHELSSFVLDVPAHYTSETVQHSGEEIIFVLEGEILQMVDDQSFLLRAGDSMHYLGQHPHSYSNPGDQPARLLWTGKMLHPATPSAYTPRERIAVRGQDDATPPAAATALEIPAG